MAIIPDKIKTVEARKKYIDAFNRTMVTIWKEQITLLNAVRTGALLRSPADAGKIFNEDYTVAELRQDFLEYGIWVNFGVGREVFRGNGGDIGREKKRQAKKWFSRKFFASYMNISEFFAESMGEQFCAVITNALDTKKFKESTNYYKSH